MMKRCRVCGEPKPLDGFPRKHDARDGHATICKPCDYAATKAWRQANREQRREQSRREHARRDPAAEAARMRRQRAKDPDRSREQTRASLTVMRAIRRGDLVRPTTCSACGAEAYIEAHHPDHSRPLDVAWLCRPCHRIADGRTLQHA